MAVSTQGIREINQAFDTLLDTLAQIEENEADRLGMRHFPADFANQVRNQLGHGVGEAYEQSLESRLS